MRFRRYKSLHAQYDCFHISGKKNKMSYWWVCYASGRRHNLFQFLQKILFIKCIISYHVDLFFLLCVFVVTFVLYVCLLTYCIHWNTAENTVVQLKCAATTVCVDFFYPSRTKILQLELIHLQHSLRISFMLYLIFIFYVHIVKYDIASLVDTFCI